MPILDIAQGHQRVRPVTSCTKPKAESILSMTARWIDENICSDLKVLELCYGCDL